MQLLPTFPSHPVISPADHAVQDGAIITGTLQLIHTRWRVGMGVTHKLIVLVAARSIPLHIASRCEYTQERRLPRAGCL